MHIFGLGTVESILLIIFGFILIVSLISMLIISRINKRKTIEEWEAEYEKGSTSSNGSKDLENGPLEKI